MATQSQHDIERKREDLEFIQHTGRWPSWPALPIKRYTTPHGPPECVMLMDTDGCYVAFFCNMFAVPRDLSSVKRINYASAQAIIDDGWMVD